MRGSTILMALFMVIMLNVFFVPIILADLSKSYEGSARFMPKPEISIRGFQQRRLL